MKKLIYTISIISTLLLITLVVYRVATKGGKLIGSLGPQQMEMIQKTLSDFAGVKTQPLSIEAFNNAVHSRGATNLNNLSPEERQKLFDCIDKFYRCYSTGNFDQYRVFRLSPPFKINAALKKLATDQGLETSSDIVVLKYAWNRFNGQNKIGEVSESSIIVSIVTETNLLSVRQPAVVAGMSGFGAVCWEGAVDYDPSPASILSKNGSIRFFTLEAFVRFEIKDGPATPIRFVGYWDPTRNNWMPYVLCTIYKVGNYDTIF